MLLSKQVASTQYDAEYNWMERRVGRDSMKETNTRSANSPHKYDAAQRENR